MKRALVTYGKLIRYLFRFKKTTIFLIALTLTTVILGALLPYLIGLAIETTTGGMGQVDFTSLYQLLSIIAVLALVYPIINWLIALIATRLSYRLVVQLRLDIFRKIHAVSLKQIDQYQVGQLNSILINDLELVITGLTHVLIMFLSSLLIILFSIAMMIYLDVLLAFIVIILIPAALLIARFIARRSYKTAARAQVLTAEYNALSEELITAGKLVTAFNYETAAQERGRNLSHQLQQARAQAMFYSSLTNPASRFINNISYVLVGLIGGLAFINNYHVTIGALTSLLLYAHQFSKPMNEMTSIATEIQSALVAIDRAFSFINQPDDLVDQGLPALPEVTGNFQMKDLSFRYQADKPLIRDFSLSVKKGEIIAIVGPTGGGKTTLVNLLMRFYEIDHGAIYLDGHNIFDFSRESLRKNFGMVLQDTWLKNATIAENLKYANPDVSDDEMKEVCRFCRVDDFISSLPAGYQTIVTEASYRISQGEKQLLTIARAMLAHPNILILDEATSAIDTRTELLIQEALERIMKGKTTFIIAHRLSTIINADQILVLNDGQIVETGNHQQLLDQKGFYWRLYLSQFQSGQAGAENSDYAQALSGKKVKHR